jgi:hypothetical protein
VRDLRDRPPSCLAPIALVFVVGCWLLVAGLMSDSTRALRAGVVCLLVAGVLLAVGWWMRQGGWWD